MPRRNVTRRLLEGGQLAFDPFGVAGAWDGYIADAGITVVAGVATQALDQTGNGNTLSLLGAGPAFLPAWRNGKAALAGTGAPPVIGLSRTTHANGPLVQPLTRYTVSEWIVPSGFKYQVRGGATGRVDSAADTLGRPFALAGATLTAGVVPAALTPVIRRDVFAGAAGSIRIEPDGSPVVSAVGNVGANQYNGILWGTFGTVGSNWDAPYAFLLDVAGNLPLTAPLIDAEIMQWMRDYYSIFHT